MNGKHKDQSAWSRFLGFWRAGAGPVVIAVALVLVVAAALDLVDDRAEQDKPKPPPAAQQAGSKTRTAPRFVVAVRRPGDAVVVRDVRTGADVGVPVSAPEGRRFHQVAAAGDRSYIVSDYASERVRFQRLRLGADGRPDELTPVAGVEVRGSSTARSDLAANAAGDRIAYVTYQDSKTRLHSVPLGSGAAKSWTTGSTGKIGSLSWAGDRLSFVWEPARKSADQARRRRQVRTLDATGSGGDLRVSRVVLELPQGGDAAVFGGDGSTIVAGVRDDAEVSLEAFSAKTGKRTTVLWAHKTDEAGDLAALSRDSGSGHLLAAGTDGRVFADSSQGVRELPWTDVTDVAW